MVHFEDFSEEGEADFFEKQLGDPKADPLAQLIDHHERGALVDALSRLPERERLMMRLYYEDDFNLREIGDVLGVSESRVCQLHKQAVHRLRTMLQDDPPQPVRSPARSRSKAPAPHYPAVAKSVGATPHAPRIFVEPLPGLTAIPSRSTPVVSPRLRPGACNQPVFQAVVG
jgi:hypothetical protein